MFLKHLSQSISQTTPSFSKGGANPLSPIFGGFSFRPQYHPAIQTDAKPVHVALNAYDLPNIGFLVHYLHAAVGFPINSTRLTAIELGNFYSWYGLTYANALKCFPVSVDSIQVHLTQARKYVCYIKPNPPSDTQLPSVKSQELFIQVEPISKLYTGDMEQFPVCSCSGNHYIMLSFHVDTKSNLVEPFQSKQYIYLLAAYECIMTCLNKRGHTTDLQILDKKSSQY